MLDPRLLFSVLEKVLGTDLAQTWRSCPSAVPCVTPDLAWNVVLRPWTKASSALESIVPICLEMA